MNSIAAPKSRKLNWLEGATLSAIFQALPIFVGAAMLLRLVGSDQVDSARGAVTFVVTTTLFYALLTPYLAPRFRASSGTATNRCSSTRACHSPRSSSAGAPSQPPRCNCWRT